ncbi:MAG: serine/threonine protein kinase [Clostridia bacterium]|nr:serine/threonine protein kinase [Clostridia bacterium]
MPKDYSKYLDYENKILEDRYIIDKFLGCGGMAVVFRARDTYLNNMVVAIKILKDDVANDETAVRRFTNEARIARELKHNNIVAVQDIKTNGRVKYMVMEYLFGITLKEYLVAKKKPFSTDEIIGYSAQILRALGEAHRNHIIHRDIKPQNIMLLKDGKVKVMDFGVAKRPDMTTLTATDKAVGTVYYMSPEQAAGKKNIDTRSDIYSLGAMMYELATGQTPFKGEESLTILVKHMQEEPVPPRQYNSSIPVGLEQIILCAMSKDPAARFQTAEEMLGYIKQLQANKKIKFDELPSNSFWKNFRGRIKRLFKKEK